MSEYIKISPEIRALGREAEREIRPYFERLEEICDRNTETVSYTHLDVYKRQAVSRG